MTMSICNIIVYFIYLYNIGGYLVDTIYSFKSCFPFEQIRLLNFRTSQGAIDSEGKSIKEILRHSLRHKRLCWQISPSSQKLNMKKLALQKRSLKKNMI